MFSAPSQFPLAQVHVSNIASPTSCCSLALAGKNPTIFLPVPSSFPQPFFCANFLQSRHSSSSPGEKALSAVKSPLPLKLLYGCVVTRWSGFWEVWIPPPIQWCYWFPKWWLQGQVAALHKEQLPAQCGEDIYLPLELKLREKDLGKPYTATPWRKGRVLQPKYTNNTGNTIKLEESWLNVSHCLNCDGYVWNQTTSIAITRLGRVCSQL